MSKKDKSKFRKRIKAQILNQMQSAPETIKIEPVSTVTQPIAPIPTKKVDVESVPNIDNMAMIKTDLKKSAIIIASILIVIVALYFLDIKTGFLTKTGTQIFQSLHINA